MRDEVDAACGAERRAQAIEPDGEAERAGGLAVDGEEEPRRLLDRQVGGFCALDEFVQNAARRWKSRPRSIAHQPAVLHMFALRKDRWQPNSQCEVR